MVVWKANQQYPIAVLHQAHGITVPAVAIERSPWGQQPQAEALRLASCSDTGKASPSSLCSCTDALLTVQLDLVCSICTLVVSSQEQPGEILYNIHLG